MQPITPDSVLASNIGEQVSSSVIIAFQNLLGSSRLMRELRIDARIYGKHGSVTTPQDTRAILPLNAVLTVCDRLLNTILEPIVSDLLKCDSDSAFFGGHKFTQPLDIAHAGELVIEKGFDRHSEGCIAQADFLKYRHQLRLLLLCKWLSDQGAAWSLIGAILRLHLCSMLFFHVGGTCFEVCCTNYGVNGHSNCRSFRPDSRA